VSIGHKTVRRQLACRRLPPGTHLLSGRRPAPALRPWLRDRWVVVGRQLVCRHQDRQETSSCPTTLGTWQTPRRPDPARRPSSGGRQAPALRVNSPGRRAGDTLLRSPEESRLASLDRLKGRHSPPLLETTHGAKRPSLDTESLAAAGQICSATIRSASYSTESPAPATGPRGGHRFRPPSDQRRSSGTNGRLVGPTYSAAGRIRRLSFNCSITWAVQPTVRLMLNVGVKRSSGRPTPCMTAAE
jgi:hypothetical protein